MRLFWSHQTHSISKCNKCVQGTPVARDETIKNEQTLVHAKIGLFCVALQAVVVFDIILLLCMWQLLEGKIVFSLTVMGGNIHGESLFFSYDLEK